MITAILLLASLSRFHPDPVFLQERGSSPLSEALTSEEEVTTFLKLETVFANAQGPMFDNGRVWFRRVGDKLKIITINEPIP